MLHIKINYKERIYDFNLEEHIDVFEQQSIADLAKFFFDKGRSYPLVLAEETLNNSTFVRLYDGINFLKYADSGQRQNERLQSPYCNPYDDFAVVELLGSTPFPIPKELRNSFLYWKLFEESLFDLENDYRKFTGFLAETTIKNFEGRLLTDEEINSANFGNFTHFALSIVSNKEIWNTQARRDYYLQLFTNFKKFGYTQEAITTQLSFMIANSSCQVQS